MGLQIPSNRVQLPTYPLDLYFPPFLDPDGNDEWPRVTCYTNFGLWYKGKVIIGGILDLTSVYVCRMAGWKQQD